MAQTGFTPIQLYFSSTTTNAPLAANLASGELAINITDGKLFYKDNANAVQVIGWKVVPATAGGTGQTSYAVGDLLYANTTTTLAKLADVATGNALISGGVGVAPSWGKIGLTTHVSGVLPVANGGTNASSASITAFNNITGYTASGATGTTSTNLVFSTSPTLTTPSVTGDATLSTGNLVIGTSGKGVTTGSSIPLGIGTNNGVTSVTVHTSGGVSIGNSTNPGTGCLTVNSKAFINATGPVQATEQFAVSSSGLAMVSKTSTAGEACLSNWNAATSGNNQFVWFYTESSATFRGSIEYNRGSGLVLYNTSSDQRLKENIVDAQNATDKLQKIKIRSYDWKDSNIHVDYGVVAQELMDVEPSCVTIGVDNEDGSIKRPWGVDTSILVPMLIKAVQELTERVAILENK